MTQMKNLAIYIFYSMLLMTLSSCEDFLSERPSSSISNISSYKDMQSILDTGPLLNQGSYSQLMEAATDNFFIGKGGFDRLGDLDQSIYLWKKHYVFPLREVSSNWTGPYRVIGIANTVLDELQNITESRGVSRESVEGTALFHRAFAYLNLVQIYCKAYDPLSAQNDLGLPLRLNSDISAPSKRASLEDTYRTIEEDINKSILLLPETSEFQTRPSKVAAHALMARLCLLMEEYTKALYHAEEALGRYDVLMNFNDLDVTSALPIQAMNEETIFFAFGIGAPMLTPTRESYIDTLLFDSYHLNDLRKVVFFKSENNGYYSFKGAYTGMSNSSCFVGLSVSELRLIQSECLARLGQLEDANASLNVLLEKRFVQGKFEPVLELDGFRLLQLVLEERRKELIFRGTRWGDLKRLNRDPRFAKTLYRKVPGDEILYELPPNDPRYVFLIPQPVIEMTGMEQNR